MNTLKHYRLHDQIGFILRRAHQHATTIFQTKMSELSLTPPQFSALVMLAQHEMVSQNQLGRLIDTDPATMQGIVKRLTDRQYIVRLPDEHHKRKINLRLTAEGNEMVIRAVGKAKLVTDETLAALSDVERKTLNDLLSKLVATSNK